MLSSYTGSPLNPFHGAGLFPYPLKTSENLWFSFVFRWYKKRLAVRYWLTFFVVLATDASYLCLYWVADEFADEFNLAKKAQRELQNSTIKVSADKEKK